MICLRKEFYCVY